MSSAAMRSGRLQSITAPLSFLAGVGSGWCGEVLAEAIATLLLCFSCGSACAQLFVWVPTLAPPTTRVALDLELGVRARKALLEDENLAGQVLGIRVQNRIAVLWGRVSSPSMARRAEDSLRNLPGLVAVRSELLIDAGLQSQRAAGAQCRSSNEALSPDRRRVLGMLVGAPPRQDSSWRPGEAASVPDRAATESLPGFPSRDTSGQGPSGASKGSAASNNTEAETPVMPAIVLPSALPEDIPEAAPTSRPVKAPTNLVQAIEALRVADRRFWGIRVDVRHESVYLGGVVDRWDHLFDFARAVAQLPGVKQVRFEHVRAESP